jgi:branched-chain amino acid transport system ATP-binding protein
VSELTFATLRPARSRTATPVLQLRGLTVKVGIRRIIQNLDLDVHANEAVRIAGSNGAGKSTLLNAIAGLEPARIEAGTITVAGEDITNLPAHERALRGIAYLKQRENIFADLSVQENLVLALGNDGPARFHKAFPDWVESLPMNKRAGMLSGGQRQRLAWAMTVLRPSQLLLADEPEAGMSDAPLWPEDRTVLVVSHQTEQIEAGAR